MSRLLLVPCLLTLAAGFPFHNFDGWDNVGSLQVQDVQHARLPQLKHSVCLHSPLLGQVCLPWAFHFFIPLQNLAPGPRRCLSIPLIRSHVVKVCSSSGERKFGETSKEIIKEVEAEAEKERLPDNTNIEVNGEEVEPGNFAEKENGVGGVKEVDDKNVETENKIIRLSEEIMEVSDERSSPEKILQYKNSQDEDVGISANLV